MCLPHKIRHAQQARGMRTTGARIINAGHKFFCLGALIPFDLTVQETEYYSLLAEMLLAKS